MGERLHPAAIAVYAVEALRSAAVPLLVIAGVSVFGGGFDAQAALRTAGFAAAGAALAAAAGALRWYTTRYGLADATVRLREGLLSVKEVEIPYARVQSVDVEQGPIQRLFGVQKVHVQTGGGGAGGEIVLGALGAREVARLRDELSRRAPRALAETTDDAPERRLSRSMLLVAALTAGQLGVILPVLATLSQTFDDLFSPRRGDEDAVLGVLPDSLPEWALAIAALVLIAWLLAALGTVVAFAGFKLRREDDVLRISRGLLARREVTLRIERVRAVRVVEGVLRQPFGLAALRVEVIGHAQEPAAAQTLFPLVRRREVSAFLEEVLPEVADDLDGLAAPPPRARRRYLLPPTAAALAIGAAAAAALGTPWLLLLALAGVAYGHLRWTAAGWRLGGGRLAIRRRMLARTTILAPAANREWHALAQTALQRRGRLADLRVAFGRGTLARIRHLDLDAARAAWSTLGTPER